MDSEFGHLRADDDDLRTSQSMKSYEDEEEKKEELK